MTGHGLAITALVAGSLVAAVGLGMVARWLAAPYTGIGIRSACIASVIAALPVIGLGLRLPTGSGLPVADLAIAALMVPIGVALTVVDLHHHRLPDPLVALGAVGVLLIAGVAALVRAQPGDLIDALWLGVVTFISGYLLMFLTAGGFGFGDVKLLAVLGLVVGHLSPSLIVVWVFALAVASIGWLVAAPYADRRLDDSVRWHKRQVAFGPAILTALWLVYALLAAVAPGVVT